MSPLVSVVDWLSKLLGSPEGTPVDIRRLSAASERDLFASLLGLPRRGRGWIMLSEAARLFSNQQSEYAFGEMDEEGKLRISEFASECGCDFQFMPAEGRLYFVKAS
jgi:hypothetical protein